MSNSENISIRQEALLRAWRRANAQWDLARCGADVPIGGDLPRDVDEAHCDETQNALMALLLHPAQNLGELAKKLRIARDEDVHALTDAGIIMAVLAKDAHDLWLAAECSGSRSRAA